MVTILALAAAVLYGTADFLGGVASRRASVFAVLAVTVPAGAVVVVAVALLGEAPWLGGLLGHGLGASALFGDWGAVGWAAASGVCGASGLIAFYAGFAAAPISVVAPVAALVSTVLPVGVAIAGGERLTASMVAGGLICLAAIVMVSMPPARPGAAGAGAGPRGSRAGDDRHDAQPAARPGLWCRRGRRIRPVLPVPQERRAVRCALAGGGLADGGNPGRLRHRAGDPDTPVAARGRRHGAIALVSGAVDAAANVCYVLATRAGLFGLAVVITSLYPGMTVAAGPMAARRADALAAAGRPAAGRGRRRAADRAEREPGLRRGA